jgi:2-polyprenyl-3-methyl-5-hydroxy-6-metoxy-1,4-benzoquinol methylase
MKTTDSDYEEEMKYGNRFAFGENWSRFLAVLSEERIQQAEQSLCDMLKVEDLQGKHFLDIGSGSGLFSLAARRLGATVLSFDYDPQSVACAEELRHRYLPGDASWKIERGSVLDENYITSLGQFDVVYSWGVLHHTGQMYKAFSTISTAVVPGGQLFIAVYNDQGLISKYWSRVKRAYNKSPIARILLTAIHAPYLFGARWLLRAVTGRYAVDRGMSLWYDMIDWLGGYPFEVAKPEEVFRYFRDRGFSLRDMKTCGGRMGCNEFLFHLSDDELP